MIQKPALFYEPYRLQISTSTKTSSTAFLRQVSQRGLVPSEASGTPELSDGLRGSPPLQVDALTTMECGLEFSAPSGASFFWYTEYQTD